MKGSITALGCYCSPVKGVSSQWGAGGGQNFKKSKYSWYLRTDKNFWQWEQSALDSTSKLQAPGQGTFLLKGKCHSARGHLRGLFHKGRGYMLKRGTEIPSSRGQCCVFKVCHAAVPTYPSIHFSLNLEGSLVLGRSRWLWCRVSPTRVSAGLPVTCFSGNANAQISASMLASGERSDAAVRAEFQHHCRLKFPYVIANLLGQARLFIQRNANLPKGLWSSYGDCDLLWPRKPPRLQEVKFWRQTGGSLRIQYKSCRVLKLTSCCSVSAPDTVIRQGFFVVSPVSSFLAGKCAACSSG